LREEPVPLRQVAPGVPPELEKVVAHCLEKDPALRYQHGGKLEAVLRSVPHQSGALIKEQRDAGDERRTLAIRGLSRRHIPAIIIALLVVTVIAGYLLRDRILRPRALAPERITLAVLPFRPLTAPEQIGFLGIGIPDAIINRLANVGRMRLRPTSAILRYQNQNVDAQQAGSALATNYVLSGTVMRVTDRFRVSVQLVRVADGATLWGQHFDLAQEDLLGLQDVIAERIVAVLRVQVTAAERQRLHHRYTENAAAYRIYLEGRSDLLQYTEQGARSAVAAFEAALRLDRNYVLARSGLAVACAKMSIRFAPEGEIQIWRQRAEAEAKQAIELDEDLGEAHEALAEVYRSVEFDWDGTIRESRRALELNPNLEMPHYYLAAAFYHLGLLEQVEPEARAGLEINPENRVEPLRVRAVAALFGGKYADAQALLIELQPLSASSFSDLYLAQARYYQGARFQAEAILSKSYTSGQAERRSPAALASFLAARGEKARAEALVKTIIAGTYMDHHVSYSLGVTYAQLHDAPNARRWLARAAETGLPCYPWFARDPLLQPLRGDAEFQKFMDGLRLSWEHAKARYTA
jgi:TolB-like protein